MDKTFTIYYKNKGNAILKIQLNLNGIYFHWFHIPNYCINYISDELSSYKQLRGGVVFMDKIPKSASGKILRRNLRLNDVPKSKL